MKLGRWMGSLTMLAGAALLVVLPALGQDAAKWEWKAFEKGKTFYQTLTTKTEQTMKVQGQEVKQNQEQTFLVSWTGLEAKEGTFAVQQKILAVKMKIDIGGVQINYDSDDKAQPNNPMTDFFKKLLEADLKLTIDKATMKVTDITGHDDLIKKLGVTNPQMEPLLQKILSKEALKEMAEPTWGAFPTAAVTKGKDWKTKSKLNLGPIGIYETDYTYTYEGPDKLGEKIKVAAALTYGVPTEKTGLPFTIKSASLKSTEGAGAAYFDKAKGRFASSTIRMKLTGTLDIEVGGMSTAVELNQDQTATSESFDNDPRKK